MPTSEAVQAQVLAHQTRIIASLPKAETSVQPRLDGLTVALEQQADERFECEGDAPVIKAVSSLERSLTYPLLPT